MVGVTENRSLCVYTVKHYAVNKVALTVGSEMRIAVICLVSLLLSAPVEAESPLPIVGDHYPPYEMNPDADGLQGFDYEVVAAVFERMGRPVAIDIIDWTEALTKTREGQAMAAMTCALTREREQWFVYSDPISRYTSGFFIRKGYGGAVMRKLGEVRDKRVAAVSSYASWDELESIGILAIGVDSTEDGLVRLISGEFDYFYTGQETTDYVVNQLGIAESLSFQPIRDSSFYLCFSRQWPKVKEIVREFNRQLDELRYSGEMGRIYRRYGQREPK